MEALLDIRLIDGVAFLTLNWSSHREKFCEFCERHWMEHGKEYADHMREKVMESPRSVFEDMYSYDGENKTLILNYIHRFVRGTGSDFISDEFFDDVDLSESDKTSFIALAH